MKSLDNLREYVLTAPSICSTTRAILVGYIDNIDREVAEVRDREYRNGREDAGHAVEFADRLCRASERREDVTLWGVDYMPYPLDADGVPIHVGDVMNKGEVTCIRDCGKGWEVVLDNLYTYDAPSLRHHAPTVEDVLTEFGIDWEHESDCEDRAALLKEYATKLQLKEDE